jgi:hypothetical protein
MDKSTEKSEDKMNEMKFDAEKYKSQGGMVLIVCVILLLMLSLIGITAITTSNTEMEISGNELYSNEAFYLADAGLEKSLAALDDSVEWRAGFHNEYLGRGTYSVVITDSTTDPNLRGRLLVGSVGRVDQVVKAIEAYLRPVYIRPFSYGAYGRDSVNFAGNGMMDSYDSDDGTYDSQVHGNHAGENGPVGSEGIVVLDGQTDIYGDASTTDGGEIVFGGGATVHGDTSTTALPPEFPPVSQDDIDYAEANNDASTGLIFDGNGNYNNGTHALSVAAHGSVTITSGIYYFSDVSVTGHGEIIIEPGAEVIIYVVGTWNSSGGTIINQNQTPSSLQIYSVGDSVLVAGGSEFYGAIYAPESDVVVTGGSDFYGSIAGRTFVNGGGTKCHYDEALGRAFIWGIARYAIEAWTQL